MSNSNAYGVSGAARRDGYGVRGQGFVRADIQSEIDARIYEIAGDTVSVVTVEGDTTTVSAPNTVIIDTTNVIIGADVERGVIVVDPDEDIPDEDVTDEDPTTDSVTINSKKMIIQSDDFAVGQYIYMNKDNHEVESEGVLVINVSKPLLVPILPVIRFISSATCEIGGSGLFLNGEFMAIGGSKHNDGVYRVVSHTFNIVTIYQGDQSDYVSQRFVPEEFSGERRPVCYNVRLCVLRAASTLGDDHLVPGLEVASATQYGAVAFHKVAHDTSSPSFAKVTLTNADTQLKMGDVTITAAGGAATHSIPNTPTDTFLMAHATQTMTKKVCVDTGSNIAAKGLHHQAGVANISNAAAPTSGQVIMAASATQYGHSTLFTVSAGEGITIDATGGGATNTNCTVSLDKQVSEQPDEELDEEEIQDVFDQIERCDSEVDKPEYEIPQCNEGEDPKTGGAGPIVIPGIFGALLGALGAAAGAVGGLAGAIIVPGIVGGLGAAAGAVGGLAGAIIVPGIVGGLGSSTGSPCSRCRSHRHRHR